MNLEPNVDKLSFFLLLNILSFNPKLKKIPNYNIIKNHLKKNIVMYVENI
jgi:hypothetical protein